MLLCAALMCLIVLRARRSRTPPWQPSSDARGLCQCASSKPLVFCFPRRHFLGAGRLVHYLLRCLKHAVTLKCPCGNARALRAMPVGNGRSCLPNCEFECGALVSFLSCLQHASGPLHGACMFQARTGQEVFAVTASAHNLPSGAVVVSVIYAACCHGAELTLPSRSMPVATNGS